MQFGHSPIRKVLQDTAMTDSFPIVSVKQLLQDAQSLMGIRRRNARERERERERETTGFPSPFAPAAHLMKTTADESATMTSYSDLHSGEL